MHEHLKELARQIRSHTIHLLESAPEFALLWSPDGTSNHILWHAGHSAWVQDLLCLQTLSKHSELPQGWEALFGANCRPVAETSDWPSSKEIQSFLESQQTRMLEVLDSRQNELSNPEVYARVLHGWHDEARHQGEMYLLQKLWNAGHYNEG